MRLEPGKHLCDSVGGTISRTDGHRNSFGFGVTMERFATFLSNSSGRPVIDKTGIKGRFDFQFEMTRDTPATDDAGAPAPSTAFIPASDYASSVFRAVAAFGLKLEPAKGPVEFLVVDHVEKPGAG